MFRLDSSGLGGNITGFLVTKFTDKDMDGVIDFGLDIYNNRSTLLVMQNTYAISLSKAAEKYLSQYGPEYRSDYDDLMKIAQLIEEGASPKTISRAVWELDTIVRDAIPDDVYYAVSFS